MTACASTRKQLSAYLDGEVSLPERMFIDGHLASCEACRKLKDELAAADKHLMSAPEPPWAANATDRLMARLKTELAKDAPRAKPAAPPASVIAASAGWGWKVPLFAVAAVCGLIVLPSLFLQSSSSRMAMAPAREASAPRAAKPAVRAPEPAPSAADAFALRATEAKTGEVAAAAPPPAPAAPAARAAAPGPAAPVSSANQVALAGGRVADGDRLADSGHARPAKATADAPAGPSPLAPLEAQLRALERRMLAVESSVSQFTTAAREQAVRETHMASARRWPEWR